VIVAEAATLDPVTTLVVNGGIIGVFFALALLGQIALRPELIRRDDQEKRQQALIDTLLAVYHHEVLPTLSDYEKRLSPLLARVEKKMDELDWYIGRHIEIVEDAVAPEKGNPRRRGPADSPRGGIR
jgi:hypothetical protein